MYDLIDLLMCHICYTPPHFADSLGTAAKCLQESMGACKDGIQQFAAMRCFVFASALICAWHRDGCDWV